MKKLILFIAAFLFTGCIKQPSLPPKTILQTMQPSPHATISDLKGGNDEEKLKNFIKVEYKNNEENIIKLKYLLNYISTKCQ
jgi:uncharacterized lipoprotein YajG